MEESNKPAEENPFERELMKKLRNSKKKMTQIDELVQKSKEKDYQLNDEQK